MNVINFINSRDVRNYLHSIDYKFTATEAAWIIYHCKNATLGEKHRAWEALTESYEDEKLYFDDHDYGSLHDYLRRYIESDDELITEFYEHGATAVYSFRLYVKGEWIDDEGIYTSFGDCFSSCLKDSDLEPSFVDITKKYPGRDGYSITCRMMMDKNIISISDNDMVLENEEKVDRDLFYRIEVSVPSPFKEGDIITCVSGKYSPLSDFGGTVVYSEAGVEREDNGYKMLELAAGGNAVPVGYLVGFDKNVYSYSLYNIYDYEHVRTELEKEERFLTPLSCFVKGELSIPRFLASYRMLLGEEIAKDGRELFGSEN